MNPASKWQEITADLSFAIHEWSLERERERERERVRECERETEREWGSGVVAFTHRGQIHLNTNSNDFLLGKLVCKKTHTQKTRA